MRSWVEGWAKAGGHTPSSTLHRIEFPCQNNAENHGPQGGETLRSKWRSVKSVPAFYSLRQEFARDSCRGKRKKLARRRAFYEFESTSD
ncbi:MAG: hypothetical protein CO108_24685 [Deltaproteobacteria bacterium CG_4_9_14_3_um_filter_63_12]|nr:MAG: hypothetical protein CO108_24685 [Deltaproteobacteria bacterium CG_4_9_14_3_um_filter_63_12]